MDLVPGKGQPTAVPASQAGSPENVASLLSALSQVDAALGTAVPKKRLPAGAVGIDVAPEQLLDVARLLRYTLHFEMLTCVSGVDMVEHVESIYHFRSLSRNWLLQIRVKLPVDKPAVDSLVALYPSANWLERETYDMVGIVYSGHPDLRRILLDDEFFGYPLLKSFSPTPITVHDRATTQVAAVRAVSGEQQHGAREITQKHLGQGAQERLHPGKLTFGSAAVYLETGQGVESGGIGEHGYSVDPESQADSSKPQRG